MNLSEYGKKVKIALIENGISQRELIERVRAVSGLYMDSSYLHKILCGKLKTPRIVDSINAVLGLSGDAQA